MSAEISFPSSQPVNNYPRIFIYPSDVSIPVFVEASSIRNRPKLIRLLRSSGAAICHDPAQAHIILVNGSTDPGRQFIRDWGDDPIKVVLEYTWVNKSVEAGRALLQNDIWGDCIALDDGQPINVQQGEELLVANSLPTPRPTPSDPESSSVRSRPDREAHATNSNGVQSYDIDHSFGQSAPRMSESPRSQTFPQSQQVLHTQNNPQPSSFSPSQQAQSNQQYPQSQQVVRAQNVSQPPPFSPSQQALQEYPQSQSYPQFPQQFSQLQQFIQSQPQQFPQPHPLTNGSGSQQFTNPQFANPFNQGSAPQMQQFSQMQLGQGVPFSNPMLPNFMGQSNGQYDPQVLLANLMDILRQQNFAMPIGMQQIQQASNNMTQQMFPTQNFQSNGMLSSGPEPPSSLSLPSSSYDGAKGSSHAAASRSQSPQRCPPSIRRRSTLASTPTPTPTPSLTPTPSPELLPKRSKGKARAISPRRNSLKRVRSHSYEESDVEISNTPMRRHSVIAPQVVSPRSLGQIFKDDSGESLLFFVQVDLFGRHGVVQNIKKNGGKMSGSITDANFVILGNAQSKTYQDLLMQATAANKLPLRHTFIADCITHRGLLDQNDYVLEDYVPPKKRPRTSTAGAVKKEEKPKVKKERIKATPKKVAGPISHNGPPSPSPVPVKDEVNCIGGHYAFTTEEVDYFKHYARCLIERDLKISNTAIMKAMQAKIPHHSANSWYNYVSRNLQNELDTLRKKIGIATRKAQDTKTSSAVKPVDQMSSNESMPLNRPSLDFPTAEPNTQAMDTTVPQSLDEQDFNDICQFFATGGGDNSDDEQVWEALKTHQYCRSAPSWPEFFKSREADVINGIDKLVKANVASTEQGQADTLQSNGNL